MKKYQSYPISIERLDTKGRGIGRYEDRQVMVPYTVPGQVVQAKLVKKRNRRCSAQLQSVMTPRPDEVQPFCAHFGQPPTESGQGCGGCKWQMLPYAAQLALKQDLLQQELAQLDPELLREVSQPAIIPSPQDRNYRNKVEFSFGDKTYISESRYLALRAEKQPLPTGEYLGFHAPGSFGTVIDVTRCHLTSPALQQVYQCIRAQLPHLGGTVYSPKHHTGYWRHLILREGTRTGDLMVHLNTTDTHQPDWSSLVQALQDLNLPEGYRIRSVLHSEHTGDAQIVGYNPPRLLWGESVIEEHICGLRFEISAYAFFQTNTPAAERLYEAVVSLAEVTPDTVIYDLYSGTGTIGMILARQGAKAVYGLEEIESAVTDAQRNATLNGIAHCHFKAGKVEHLLPELFAVTPPDLMIVDPPRAGLHPKAVTMILDNPAPQLIYVSCNPSALARDLALLAPVYQPEVIQAVDLFPQTAHLETIVKLKRK